MSLFAAFFLGLLASGHCVLMCGGIAGALGVATDKDERGQPRRHLLVGYQLGRILSYTLAGLLVGGAGGALIALLDVNEVRLALRIASAAALLLAALVMLGVLRDPGSFFGNRLWPRLAPIGKRLLPVNTLPRAIGFGAVWGWMPCGFVYTILLVAALGAQPIQSAGVMAAFGLGTLPAMLATSWGAPKLMRFSSSLGLRRSAGVVLLACAAITLAAPMLVGHAPWLQRWLPFDCS
ncbi:sulfite exporter TauE/SafE family protein [Dokdonella sp.]|uniref:sulfite exporter TauE/SafE family protein n=1 Tax=Dokdonella sp. TaxID=2291710 RepID=UPI0035289ED1